MRKVVVALVLAGVVAVPALSVAIAVSPTAAPLVTVKPATGSPRTRFRVSFRAPQPTGPYRTSQRRYVLSADGPQRGSRCVHDAAGQLPAAGGGARLTLTLNPAKLGGAWCVGTYRGRIDEIQTPACPYREVCPAYVLFVGTVGKFSFRVERPRSH